MPARLTVSVVIPTRARPQYLVHTLNSLVRDPEASHAELIVVCDGPEPRSREAAEARGARVVELPQPSGLNSARNAGIAACRGELVAFIDDDVEVPVGWLAALLAGAEGHPGHDVFGGPIYPRLEGFSHRVCGAEPPPVTILDLGPVDRDARLAWGANLAIRSRAFARLGEFDARLSGRGDEEEWLRRYTASGGRIRYLARAGVIHRRNPADSSLPSLTRTAYAHGRAARRYDTRRDSSPTTRAELRTFAGCLWHTGRRRCAFGFTMAAHSLGRIVEATAAR